MKNFIYIISLSALSLTTGAGCTKWTEPQQKQIEHIGGYATMSGKESEDYYDALRKYKQQIMKHERPVAFGWFSNWSPTGPIRKGYLSAVPDSMDIISMWSGAPDKSKITPDQKRDKEFVQKVKGIKLLEVSLLSHLGKGRTPDSVYIAVKERAVKEKWSDEELDRQLKYARWDYWGFKSHNFGNVKELHEALAKYAKALCESLYENEWDGFDIDWEPGNGFNDMDGTLHQGTIEFLIKEMGKYIGPKSDPEGKGHKLLCIDGHIGSFSEEIDEYVDYWISQSYGRAYSNFKTPGNKPEKLIITENFESLFKSGGNLLKQAALMPPKGYKGGFGAYRFDNDYNNVPDYKWMRKAIQINQQVFRERKKSEEKNK